MDDMEQRFCLKWSEFRTNLTEGFHDLLEENLMVDVTLAADGKFLQAHKLVLSVCSPYFKNLFKVNPCKHPIVILKDVGHSELSDMLQFMYKGEVGVRHDDLPAFFKLADTLKIKGLTGEKIQDTKYNLLRKSNLSKTRVRKKRKRIQIADCNKENAESPYFSDKSDDKLCNSKSCRNSLKSKQAEKKSTKPKQRKVDGETVNVYSDSSDGGVSDNSDKGDSDDLRENFSLPVLTADKIKCDQGSVSVQSNCEVKSSFEVKENTDNKNYQNSLDDGDKGYNPDGDSDVNDCLGDTDDFDMSASQFDPNNSTDADQTPQGPQVPSPPNRHSRGGIGGGRVRGGPGHISSLIISRAPRAFVWDYFLKETHQAICLNCGKTFKGQRPNTICEQHLKRMHPEFYKILLEKKIKRAELHMNPMVMGLGIPTYEHE